MEVLNIHGQLVYKFSPAHGRSDRFILFSHATGIAALSYKSILQRWADAIGLTIFTFDTRGHGTNEQNVNEAYQHGLSQIPWLLCDDLKKIFSQLSKQFPGLWSLAGHSLGGWLSLYSAQELNIEHVILLDMPLLAPTSAFLWATACLFQQRGFHPLSSPARRRKRLFRNRKQALTAFRRNSFFRNWEQQHIENYIDANFETQTDGSLRLRHDPQWEADIFESQPALHTPHFLKINSDKRKSVQIELIAGSQSRICDPTAIRYFHRLFPHTRWLVVPQGGHMFPFENTQGLLAALELAFPRKKESFFDHVELKAV